MKQHAWRIAVLAGVGLLAGCVERRFVVHSDPPGAVVLRNNEPIGAAPADSGFQHYGTYEFTLIKDGFETMKVRQDVRAPWYEYPPFDFIVENLWPFTVVDRREFTYTLQPAQQVRSDELLNRAESLRDRGRCLQPPPP